MQYAILCYHDEKVTCAWSREHDEVVMAKLGVVQERLIKQGKLGPVARLMPTTAAMTLRKDGDPPLVLDGPFAETKEQLLGFYVVDFPDEAAADELYKGKLLRVSGLVDYVGTDLVLDAPQVILSGAAKDKTRGVDCVFDARYEKQVAKIEQGDNVTVLGTCEGSYKDNVLLRDCEPVEE